MQPAGYNTEDSSLLPQQTYASNPQNGYSKSPNPVGENASYYGAAPPAYTARAPTPEPESDRGIGSTLVGGIDGAYIGHQMGGGMATAGGAVVGALGANAVSHGLEHHQQQQQQQQYSQQFQPQYQPQYQQAPYLQGYQQPPIPGTTTTTTTTTTSDGALGRLGGLGGGLGGVGGMGRLGHHGRVLNRIERKSEILHGRRW